MARPTQAELAEQARRAHYLTGPTSAPPYFGADAGAGGEQPLPPPVDLGPAAGAGGAPPQAYVGPVSGAGGAPPYYSAPMSGEGGEASYYPTPPDSGGGPPPVSDGAPEPAGPPPGSPGQAAGAYQYQQLWNRLTPQAGPTAAPGAQQQARPQAGGPGFARTAPSLVQNTMSPEQMAAQAAQLDRDIDEADMMFLEDKITGEQALEVKARAHAYRREFPASQTVDPITAHQYAFQAKQEGEKAALGAATAGLSADDQMLQYTARAMNEYGRRRDEVEFQRREQRERLDAQVGERVREIKAAEADYAKMGIDPARDIQGWTGVLGIIASMLGGASAALTGGPNVGLDTMNRIIDRSVAAQRAAIEKAGTQIGRKTGMLAHMYNRIGDIDLAAESFKEHARKAVLIKLKEFGARTQSPAVQARIAAMGQQIEANQKEGRWNMVAKVRTMEQQRAAMAQAAAAQAAAARAAAAPQGWLDLDKVEGEYVGTSPNAGFLLVRSKRGAKDKMQRMAAETQIGLDNLDRVVEIMKDPTWRVSPTKFAEVQQKIEFVIAPERHELFGTAVTEIEAEMGKKRYADPSDKLAYVAGTIATRLDGMKRQITQNRNKLLEGYGATPIEHRVINDKRMFRYGTTGMPVQPQTQ